MLIYSISILEYMSREGNIMNKAFFIKGVYNVSFDVIEGKMPCAIAIIKKITAKISEYD